MAYAEEQFLGTTEWTQDRFEEYAYSYKDDQLSNRMFSKASLAEEELEHILHRLAQVASVSGSVAARANLAQYGGIGVNEARLFTSVVNSDLDSIGMDDEFEVLRRARAKRNEGDYGRYLALSAVIGYYPPEYGDSKPCPDSATADPYYDVRGYIMNPPFSDILYSGNGN
jgi:hypothetical protein